MKSRLRIIGAATVAAAALLGGWGVATSERARAADGAGKAEAPPAAERVAAQALVGRALDAELRGDAAARAQLLEQALQADPNLPEARWHSGQVQFAGAWRTLDQVQSLTANDPRWVKYRALRDSFADGPVDHVALGRYCRDHQLVHEGRYHWAHVLLAAPTDREARVALGVQEYRGGLFTKAQIDALELADREAEAHRKRLQGPVTRLCREATGKNSMRRADALNQIRRLDDPGALVVLEPAAAAACSKAPLFAAALQLAVIDALGNMPDHDATLRLLNHAVFAESGEVRRRAAEQLATRPRTDYVPLLMAALSMPVDVQVDLFAAEDGTVRLIETMTRQGAEQDRVHVRSTNYETEGAVGFDRRRSDPAAVLETNLARVESIADQTQREAEAANARAAEINERIAEVLRITTEADPSLSVEERWEAWEHENELVRAVEEPVVRSYEESTSVYAYPQAPAVYPRSEAPKTEKIAHRPEPPRPGGFRPRNGFPRRLDEVYYNGALRSVRRYSCFVAGTTVWTPLGGVPIEQIAEGDLVLAQHPVTGELDFRPVLGTTVGRPTGVVNLKFDEETIGATLGHRFWVNAQGWRMAKELETHATLHALAGPVQLRSVEKAETV
ncbi:MAG TPA: hypothetical protein VEQ85_01175, partial [Lacipirellulaceae bacterium]|nr:hypothetical protein [Lacipirellulaceae bacterium]